MSEPPEPTLTSPDSEGGRGTDRQAGVNEVLRFPGQAFREHRDRPGIADMDSAERVKRLEEALLDYVERYGATDLARAALRPTEPEDRGHVARTEAPGDQA
jgi:hypothetical protein